MARSASRYPFSSERFVSFFMKLVLIYIVVIMIFTYCVLIGLDGELRQGS